MQDFLAAVLNFKSPGLRLALDQRPVLTVPTTTVRAHQAVFNVPPMTAEKMEALFRSIATPAQRRELKRDGRVRFIFVFETTSERQQLVGGFRVEAKGVNGRLVLLTCQNLRRYSSRADQLASANNHD
jgi:hypothetical protein